MEFSPQQEVAIRTFRVWHQMSALRGGYFYLAGYAGTGKTTLAQHLAGIFKPDEVRFAAFTGKAALVMRRKGCKGASTIHSLIYQVEPLADGSLRTTLTDANVRGAKLIVIDECSMVDERMGQDLLSFGIPVLVLGDPFQLPPVKGGGYFMREKPHVMLEDIHRQAENNPILRLATALRKGTYRGQAGSWGALRIVPKAAVNEHDVARAGIVICGRNQTRYRLNVDIRTELDRRSHLPERHDTLICLRNHGPKGIFNGELFAVEEVLGKGSHDEGGPTVKLQVRRTDDPRRASPLKVSVPEFFFAGPDAVAAQSAKTKQNCRDQFDFGYAITCHKSQGSQWEDVMVFDESRCFREHARQWLYTAVTRASETLTVVRT